MKYHFGFDIRENGKNYYTSGNVLRCLQNDRTYYAKVRGSNNNIYDVIIDNSDYKVTYKCSCQSRYFCKHEYAVLMALSYRDYKKVTLKPEVFVKQIKIHNLIESVPSEDLKAYMLKSIIDNKYTFNLSDFCEHFPIYIPKQEYEYYYNNLYNALVLDLNVDKKVISYLEIS